VLNRLNQWACARAYGIGSKLHWDPQFLIESLKDTAIYMAYYTIAHYLHKDIFVKNPGVAGFKPEQMIDELQDCVFARRELSDGILKESRSLRVRRVRRADIRWARWWGFVLLGCWFGEWRAQ